MHILWYGLSSFKLISKDTTIFTDPFGKAAGLTPPRGAGSVIISSAPDSELANNYSGITGEPFIIQSPGEYDVKGIFVRGIPIGPGKKQEGKPVIDRTAIYTISAEGISVGFLGMLNEKTLTETQIEELNDIDVLILPVGGNSVCNAEAAIAITNEVEPKVVIPMCYKTPGVAVKFDPVDRFLKEMGSKGEEMDKFLLKKSDLIEEKTRLILLTPQRG